MSKKKTKKKKEKLNKFVHIIISPPVLSLLCVAWIALGYESCLGALEYVFNTLASCNLPDKISVCARKRYMFDLLVVQRLIGNLERAAEDLHLTKKASRRAAFL